MSRIAAVKVHVRPVALVRPFVTAVRRATAIDATLVEVIDVEGRHGWGEAPTSWRVTGESAASVRATVEGPLTAAVVGMDASTPEEVGAAIETAVIYNAAARMAVDCAVYDLAAQSAGLSLAESLAQASHGARLLETVRTDMTLSAATRDDEIHAVVEAAVHHAEEGFHTLKLKVGAGADDVATMRRVRQAVGPDVVLRADANQGWDRERALFVIRSWEGAGLDVQLVEQPVAARDLEGLAWVTARVDTTILADESVRTSADLAEVIARRGADMVNVKLAKTGGLTEARRLVALATEHDLGVVVGCMMESHVGIGAAASLAAAVPGGGTHDLDTGLWLKSNPIQGGIRYAGEILHLADGHGLGITGLVDERM